jgi:hypothetical protein
MICRSAKTSAVVAPQTTTDVNLRLQCSADNGGLDTTVTATNPPTITGLQFDPGKFALACEPVTIVVTAVDPEGLALSYAWSLVSGPTKPLDPSTSLAPAGPSAAFFTSAPGDYSLRVDVSDVNGTASLNFPLHILPSVGTTCNPGTDGGGATLLAARPPRKLPLPPTAMGCYQGTANGWVSIPCSPSEALGPVLTPQETIETPNGASQTIPFQFGQVDTTFTAFESETDNMFGANAFSLQGNTNFFQGTNHHEDWVQLVVAPQPGTTTVKMETWNLDTFGSRPNPNGMQDPCRTIGCGGCTGGTCTVSACGCTDIGVTNVPNRTGGYNQFDFATVAASVYSDDDGNAVIGMVAQFSWYDSDNDPQDRRGLYAFVAPDQYGLGTSWTGFSGTTLGLGNRSTANFANSSVLTRTLAGSCVGGSTPALGIPWPGTCAGSPALLPDTMIGWSSPTAESNNLCLVGQPTPLVAADTNLVWSENLFSTSCSGPPGTQVGTCISSANRIFVKTSEEDTGVRPINLGTEPFWESPDLFLVPAGSPVSVDGASTETLVSPGEDFDVYVRVNNDFGCNPVTGAKALVYLADPSALSVTWDSISNGQYRGSTLPNVNLDGVTVPSGGRALIGPFRFTAPTTNLGNGHRCILAAIEADGEPGPNETTDPLGSFQVAQRNLQFSNCEIPLTNATTSSGNVTLTLTASGATPSLTGMNNLSVTFDDPNGTWAAVWVAGTGSGVAYQVMAVGGQTTVRLGHTSVALDPVPLAAGQSVTGTAAVSLGPEQPTTTLQVGATLTDSGGNALVGNGVSCVGMAPPG